MLALAAPGDAAYAFAVSVAARRAAAGGLGRGGARAPAGRAALPRGRADRAGAAVLDAARALAQRDRGARRPPRDCLRVLMAHTDSMPAGPGAEDNASGSARWRRSRRGCARPRCDVWLVATGAEERLYTGSPDHLGALRAGADRAARGGCATRSRSTRSARAPGCACARRSAAPRARRGARAAARGRAGADVRAGLAARQRHRQLRPPRARARRAARRSSSACSTTRAATRPATRRDRLRKGAFRAVAATRWSGRPLERARARRPRGRSRGPRGPRRAGAGAGPRGSRGSG